MTSGCNHVGSNHAGSNHTGSTQEVGGACVWVEKTNQFVEINTRCAWYTITKQVILWEMEMKECFALRTRCRI